jgi:hypothetical protein
MSLSKKRRNPISLSLAMSIYQLYVRMSLGSLPCVLICLAFLSKALSLSLSHTIVKKELLVLVLATATYIDLLQNVANHQSALATNAISSYFKMGIVPSTIESPLYPNYFSIYTCRPLHLSNPPLSLSLSLSLSLPRTEPDHFRLA